jgi:hypothetical protein
MDLGLAGRMARRYAGRKQLKVNNKLFVIKRLACGLANCARE